MSKYDNLKYLKETKARKSRACDKCVREIEKDETYFKESIDRVNIIGMKLRGFCDKCFREQGDKLMTG